MMLRAIGIWVFFSGLLNILDRILATREYFNRVCSVESKIKNLIYRRTSGTRLNSYASHDEVTS
jgi:hypothetical protein